MAMRGRVLNKAVKNLLGVVAAIAVVVVTGVWVYTEFFAQKERSGSN